MRDKDHDLAVADDDARTHYRREPDLLQVPSAALFRRSEGWGVFAVRGGRARLQAVAVGRRGEGSAEVRGGLSEGEAVILYPGDQVQDGARVKARPEPAPSAP